MTRSIPLDAFRIQHSMMTKTGIWPKENPDRNYKIRTFMSWFLSWALFLTFCLEAFSDLNDFTKLSEILYILITFVSHLTKLAAFTYHKKAFLDIINFLQDPVFTSYSDDMDHYLTTSIKYSTLIANIYRYTVLCLMLLYGIYPVFDNVHLAFPFPYDLGKYTYFMLAFQVFAEAWSAWNNTCLDTLCTALMGLGAAQLDILAEKIARCKQEDDQSEGYKNLDRADEKVIKHLTQCVEHHLAIIRVIEAIESIFALGILSQFVASAIVICNTLFHLVLISLSFQFAMLANYLAAMVAQPLMYCWYGNNVMWKSIQIGDACYRSNWYFCGKKVRRYLFIMMERSKRPLKITALKFSTLSLSAFLSVLQWSYSYLALLLRMYHKQY